MPSNTTGEQWHLDKRVPVALIAALLMQTALGVWWAATMDAENRFLAGRVDRLESDVARNEELVQKIDSRLARIEIHTGAQAETMRELLKALRSGWGRSE